MCIGMQNGNLFRYYNTSSIIHSLNPLCKLLGLFIFLFMIIVCSSVRGICGLSLVLLYIMVISNISFKDYFKILWFFRYFILFIFLIGLFFGIYSDFILVCRLCLCFLYFSVLYFTTSLSEISSGFSLLFRPFSFLCLSKFSNYFTRIFCFVPFIFSEYYRISRSQLSRGLNYCDSFSNRVLCYKTAFISSIVLTFRKIKGLRLNYDSGCVDFEWHVRDVYMIACHLLVLVFVLIKEVVL